MEENTTALINGNILTLEKSLPRAEAILICNGRIVHIGKTVEVVGTAPARSTVIDLKGRTVLPGFTDSHAHMLSYGLLKSQADCQSETINSIARLVDFLRNYTQIHHDLQWIRASGYDETRFSDGRGPTRNDLDIAVSDRPCIVTRVCSHISVINSRAIQALTERGQLFHTEGFERDERGELTGVVREAAQQYVLDLLPPFSEAEIDKAIDVAQQDFLRRGICAVHDPGTDLIHPDDTLSSYQRAVLEDRLQLRTYLMVRPSPEISVNQWLDQTRFHFPRLDDKAAMLRLGAIKLFADGSIGGRTAALDTHYEGTSDHFGVLLDPEILKEQIDAAHRSGFQICVHAMGERAVRFVLGAIREAQDRWPRNDCRHRIEHCGICSPETVSLLKAANIIPVVQPDFIRTFGCAYIRAVGFKQASRILPHLSFLTAGLVVPESSDAPILAPNPLSGIQTAVTRLSRCGRPFFPEETVSVLQAVIGYTRSGAYAAFQEDLAGSFAVGKLGDAVVLEEDPFQVPAESIQDIPVHITIVGGRIAFSR